MNQDEARRLIEEQLASYREKPYAELVKMIGEGPFTGEFASPAGTAYQYEIDVLWDGKPNGDVRVLGSIDDGGWRAFCPLCSDFVKGRDDGLIGE